MKKYMFFMLTFIGAILYFKPLMADMPMYADDEEFKHCTKVTGDWDNCVKEEMLRTLDDVKRLYKSVLSNPTILKWHEKPAENTEILRDMYDSWSAFRNRLCLLSYRASAYVEPLFDERFSCNLYYTQHHKDHLSKIVELMEGKAPEKRADFDFLKLTYHDDKYNECMKKNDFDTCVKDELERSSQNIKNLYKSFIEDEFVGKWNNGPSLKQGNYRDMYDSWIAYRNRLCSLAIWAYKNKYGDEAPKLEQCLQFFNGEKYEAMENLLTVAHSSLDEGMEEEGESGDAYGSTAAEIGNDGGEEIGKSIPPLQKRISSGSDRTDDELVTEYSPKEEKNEVSQPQTEQQNKNIPAWAQQK